MELVVAVYVVLFVAALFQASVGFGANLIAMPIVIQLDPTLVPGSVLTAITAINILVFIRDRGSINGPMIFAASAGAGFGSIIGLVVLRRLSDDGLAVVVAVSVLAVVGLAGVRRVPPRTTRTLLIAGTASGFSGSTAGIAGPPMALLFADAPPGEFRGSLGAFFLSTSVTSLTALHFAGRFATPELGAGLALAPATILGFVVAHPLLKHVNTGLIRPAVLTISALSALVLLGRVVAF